MGSFCFQQERLLYCTDPSHSHTEDGFKSEAFPLVLYECDEMKVGWMDCDSHNCFECLLSLRLK